MFKKANSLKILPILVVATSCKTSQTSTLHHDLTRPVRSSESWQWVEVSLDNYLSFGKQFHDLDLPPQSLESDKTRVVSRILTNIDTHLRRQYARELEPVPTPKAFVVNDGEINAFVGNYPVCFSNVAFKISTPVTGRSEEALAATVQPDGTMFALPRSPAECSTIANESLLADIVKSINDNTLRCRVQLVANQQNFEIVADKNCLTLGEMEYRLGARHFAYLPTVKWIGVHAGLIDALSPQELEGVLAHELGHYYRGHSSGSERRYGYLYHISSYRRLSAPIPLEKTEPNLRDLVEGFKEDRSGYLALKKKTDFLFGFKSGKRKFPAQPQKYPPNEFWGRIYSDHLEFERIEKALDAASYKILTKYGLQARKNGWGYYTTEQEADELAVEWLLSMGRDPQNYVQALIKMAKLHGDNSEECDKLIETRFRDKEGLLVNPPIERTLIENPHHEYCFRLANVVHEVEILMGITDTVEREKF